MATTDKRLKSYESALEEALSRVAGSRVGQTVLGGAKNSLASDINSGATIYDLTQGARDAMMGMYVSDSANSLRQAKQALAQLEREGASAYEIENQQTVVNSLQGQYDAMSMSGAVQRGATQAAYQLADDIRDSAAASIAKAKDGLNAFGKMAVDVGAALTQMGIDAAKSQLFLRVLDSENTGSVLQRFAPQYPQNSPEEVSDLIKLLPLTTRRYGEHTQTARLDGADTLDASLYGVVTAIADAKIEDILDGLMGAYGVGKYDIPIKNGFKSMVKSEEGKKLLGVAATVAGEGFESLIDSVVRQSLKIFYNGKDGFQNISEADWRNTFCNALVDGILGISGGIKSEYFTKSK